MHYLTLMPAGMAISFLSWGKMGAPLFTAFWRFLPLFLILKIISGLMLWYYQRSRYPLRLFFYFNLGIGELRLYTITFILDLLTFFMLILIIHIISLIS